MTRHVRRFIRANPHGSVDNSLVLLCGTIVTAMVLLISSRATSAQSITPNHVFDGCGTVIVDKLYYCYLFQADSDNSIFYVPGIDSYAYDPGDRLHVNGVMEDASSFCTLDGQINDPSISHCAADCPADLDGSGVVDVLDLLGVLADWGSCEDGDPCAGDLDQNGVVNAFDLLELLSSWGPCV